MLTIFLYAVNRQTVREFYGIKKKFASVPFSTLKDDAHLEFMKYWMKWILISSIMEMKSTWNEVWSVDYGLGFEKGRYFVSMFCLLDQKIRDYLKNPFEFSGNSWEKMDLNKHFVTKISELLWKGISHRSWNTIDEGSNPISIR